MLLDNNNYTLKNRNISSKEIVTIPISLSESIQGKYFVGQTDTLIVSNRKNAWASLVNPIKSGVDLYVNVFTISNFSDDYLTAEIWLNTNKPEKWNISHKISPTNTALNQPHKNIVNIKFIPSTIEVPKSGVNVYERIVPPKTTLVAEEDGKFIEPPGGNYTIIIKSSSSKYSKVIIAFGWWEKPIYC